MRMEVENSLITAAFKTTPTGTSGYPFSTLAQAHAIASRWVVSSTSESGKMTSRLADANIFVARTQGRGGGRGDGNKSGGRGGAGHGDGSGGTGSSSSGGSTGGRGGRGSPGSASSAKPDAATQPTESKPAGAPSKPKKCWICGEEGHISKNCPQKPAEEDAFFSSVDNDDRRFEDYEVGLDSQPLRVTSPAALRCF